MTIFISIMNYLIDLVVLISTFCLSLLPQSPFSNMDFTMPEGLSLITYIIPISDILKDYVSLLTAMLTWYIARLLLRYIKMIS